MGTVSGIPPAETTTDRPAERRARILDRLDGGAMVLPAAPQRFRSQDSEYRYRPDSELYYCTGITEPGVVAVLRDSDEEERFVLFVRSRDPEAERWSGPRTGPEEAAGLFGADAAHPLAELEERLPGLLERATSVHYRLGVDDRTQALVLRALSRARTRGLRKGIGPRLVVDPGVVLDELRLRKDEDEIRTLRGAAALTVEGFREALALVAPGVGEWEVESALEASFRREGGRGPAFPTIVGSGANACILHYVENRDRMQEGQLLLVDGGADLDLYQGDLTRTVPVSGAFQPVQRALYEVVEEARTAAVEAVAPGATTDDVHRAAVEVLVDGMLDLGLLSGSPEDALEEGAHKAFFPHNTSHWLGLDVHDPADYARQGRPRTLEPGMVLTVEPGLYVPEKSEGAPGPFTGPHVDRFRGTGIRIEDDVLVTSEGRENLTESLPTAPDAVAALVSGGEG